MEDRFKPLEEFDRVGHGGIVLTLDVAAAPGLLDRLGRTQPRDRIIRTHSESIADALACGQPLSGRVGLLFGRRRAGACDQARELPVMARLDQLNPRTTLDWCFQKDSQYPCLVTHIAAVEDSILQYWYSVLRTAMSMLRHRTK